jgi:low affinity Fe/Cu permease
MQSNSPAFSFNAIDWMKTVRFLVVLIAGAIVTYGIPFLTHFSYVWHGNDYTTVVLFVVTTLGEGLRRYVADHSATTSTQ